KNLEMSAKTELFLYLASRAQHLKEVILPALESGKIVLCDRFTDSTVIYQGYGRKLPLKELEQVTKFASQDLQPQLTFLLDIDVKRGLSRLRGSPNNDFHSTSSGHDISYQLRVEVNRFDEEALQFHEVIRQEFLNRAKEYSDRFRVIDADAGVEEISKKIREVVDAFLS
ncbi:MAG TPA: dTMP kinase, partial [Candidatus Manganitrophaceae bacterium]|nr:dTMP kinase [Candidatus Manganitrophaceae bacterium]